MRRLIEYLPERHQKTEIGAFQEGLEPVTEILRETVADFQAQLWPGTATWGLSYWEQAFGLAVDISKSLSDRRSRVIAKIRGGGATTAAMICDIASSFTNGEVEIIEYPNEFRFEVHFVGTVGTPPNLDDLTDAINEVKPAHLSYDYVITYRTWKTLAGMTWAEISGHTWEEIKEDAI